MILLAVPLDPSYNGGSPLDDQVLETVALVKVGVHVLFHGLLGLATLLAFEVEFHLLSVHITDKLLKLFQRESPLLCRSQWHSRRELRGAPTKS